jgi:hypothetical protein
MPGEFIGPVTVGNGCGLEFGSYLEDGDVIELGVERQAFFKNRLFFSKIDFLQK